MKNLAVLFLMMAVILVSNGTIQAQSMGSAFTYQGRLTDGGSAAGGQYDLEFTLYDEPNEAGIRVGDTETKEDVNVYDGYFTVVLDFNSGAFNGDVRWLEIGVRPGATSGSFTTLSPRQELTPMPYALYSMSGGFWKANGDNQKWDNAYFMTPGDDLQTAYNWLKSSDRDGAMGALSATNRRTLVLSPGRHTITSKVTFDNDYVDVVGLSTARDSVLIYGDFATTLIEQTAAIANFSDFSMYNADSTHGDLDAGTAAMCFVTNAVGGDNTGSRYTNLYAGLANAGRTTNGSTTMSVGFFCLNATESGVWRNCEGPFGDWRGIENCTFQPTMYDCISGDFSFGGDGEITGNGIMNGSYYRCHSGDYSFGSCTTFGIEIGASAYFEDCIGGDNCFGINKTVAGTFIRCSAGLKSFGGYSPGAAAGYFNGIAKWCTAGWRSFGSGHESCGMGGELRDCVITGLNTPIYLVQTAVLKDCRIEVTTADMDGVYIKSDSPPPIIDNCEIEVYSGGSGIPINAGSSKSARVTGCRFNNAVTGSPTGLGANVTNTAPDPKNIMTDAEPKETLTAAAPALRIDVPTEIDSTDNAVDGTLAAGTFLGQIKTIVMIEASNSSTVAVANHITSDPEVFTFDDVDEALVLMWTGDKWVTLYATATV